MKIQTASLGLVFGLTSVACTPKESGDAARSKSEPAATQAPAPEAEPTKREAPVGDPGDAMALATSTFVTCVLQRAGTVACWGDNRYGQLGQDHRDEVAGVVLVPGLDDAVAISLSGNAGCAARRSGVVVCWGDAANGELGNGKTEQPRGLVEVVGVRDVTGLFGARFGICATTVSGRPWCWGKSTDMYPLFNPPSDRAYGPFPLDLEGVRALYFGDFRHAAYRMDGSVLAWRFPDPPTPLLDVVEVRSVATGLECVVRTSGDVACTVSGKREVVVESLRGARQLSLPLARPDEMRIAVVGILPDGTMATGNVHGEEAPTFSPPHELAALAPDYLVELIGISRDRRVYEWDESNDPDRQHDYVAREIVLPEPSTVGSAIPYVAAPERPLVESSLPSWCSVEIETDWPGDRGTLEEMAKTIGARPSDSESLCDSTLGVIVNHDNSECSAGGPWLVLQEDNEIAMVLRVDGERLGRIQQIANYGEEGTELMGWKIRSSCPVDGWLACPVDTWLHVREQDIDRHIVFTGLDKRELLRTEVTIDKANREQKFDAPSVVVADGMVDVTACGGRYRAPLPPGVREFRNDAISPDAQ